MTDTADDESGGRGWSLDGRFVPVRRLAAGLHVVATPIGNLGDVTLRALSTLAAADLILAEDTRVTRRLLDHYGIKGQLRRFDAHAGEREIAGALELIAGGQALALVSDAGTPLLSDPGSALVARAAAAALAVHPLPGPSALLAALAAAGVPADRFFFEGFLPSKAGDRRRRIRALAAVPGALVFYEAPHRVAETLADLATVLGDRPAAAARELTKLHETITRGTLAELAQAYGGEGARGEFVLVVGAPGAAEDAHAGETDLDARLTALMATMSVKDAAAVAAGESGRPRREVYARALLLAKERAAPEDDDGAA
jgi:16S rRNA (cytidine1402-2'-O)-methyltransferase